MLLASRLSPVTANATSTIGIWPGQVVTILAHRRIVAKYWRAIVPFVFVTVAGSVAGAALLVLIGNDRFRFVIPILIAISCVFTMIGPRVSRFMREMTGRHGTIFKWATLVAVSVYGGFFGAGIRFVYIGILNITLSDAMNVCNAAKNVLTATVNVSALALFAISGVVDWKAALLVAIGGLFGGYAGVRMMERVPDRYQRIFVVLLGTILTVSYFYRELLSVVQ